MTTYQCNKLINSEEGYQCLAELYAEYKDTLFDQIDISISGFMDANMASPLGAILDRFREQLNTVNILLTNNAAQTILQKNTFLCNYSYAQIMDTNNTALPYQRYKTTDSLHFVKYVDRWLLSRGEMPTLSPKLKTEILGGITEIFANSSIHAESEFIYVCGQFFPNKCLLCLTITDIGNGIRNTINKANGYNLDSIEAIKWAMIDGNTTKTDTPGGYGFDILKKLILRNKGILQIVSNDGFYQMEAQSEKYKCLNNDFPGTVVSLQFRTDDYHSYHLKGEYL